MASAHTEALRFDRERDRRLRDEERATAKAAAALRAEVRAAHAEALRMDRERDARLRAEAHTAAARARQRAQRAAAARRQREREAKRLRVALGSARARMVKAIAGAQARQETVRRLTVDLARAEDRPVPALRATSLPAAAAGSEPRVPVGTPTGDLEDLIARTRADVVRRSIAPSGDRRVLLRRAIVDVANARGAGGMRTALHVLAIEALAWEHQLRGGGRDLGAAVKDTAA